jgi:hypothetical protein
MIAAAQDGLSPLLFSGSPSSRQARVAPPVRLVLRRAARGRDRVWKASAIRSEIRSRAELKSLRFAFVSAPFTNEIPRTDPLVQVDYLRVVDLDIGASKSDNLRDQSGHHFGVRRQNSSLQPRSAWFDIKPEPRPP